MNIEKIFFLCDAPELAQLRLQDPSTTTMEGLLEFNKHLLFVITIIVVLVAWLMFATISNYDEFNNPKSQNFFHSNALEIVWTSLPALTGRSRPRRPHRRWGRERPHMVRSGCIRPFRLPASG